MKKIAKLNIIIVFFMILIIAIFPSFSIAEDLDWKTDNSINLQQLDVTLLKNYERGKDVVSYYLQGMTVTNKYIIFAQTRSNTENTFITVVDRNSFAILNIINDFCFGHANNLTYNSKEDLCYMSYYTDTENYIARFRIDENYQISELQIRSVKYYFGSIAYNADKDQFIVRKSKTIYIMDYDFNIISSFDIQTDLTKQDMVYHNNRIYIACHEAGVDSPYQANYNSREKQSNLIYTYDLNGNLKRTLYIPNTVVAGEIEDLYIDSNDNMVIGFNERKNISFYETDLLKDITKRKITGFKVSKRKTDSITLKWNRKIGATGYKIYKSTSEKGKYKKIETITKSSKTNYTVTGLAAGKKYYFKMVAYKTIDGKNKATPYSKIIKTATKPERPKIKKITKNKKQKVKIVWNKVKRADGYETYLATSKKGKYKLLKNTSLKNKKTYYFKMRSYIIVNNKKVYSSYSNTKSIKL